MMDEDDIRRLQKSSDPKDRAFVRLRHYLKDSYDNLHGPAGWNEANDSDVEIIVEDLIDAARKAVHMDITNSIRGPRK